MLRATITYSTKLYQFHRFECEMSVLESELLQRRGMQLQFQSRDQQTGDVRIVLKGWLEGYAAWSESPVALALRAFHTLYTDWHESIPSYLREHRVESAQVAITYVHKKGEALLTSAVATREPGTVEHYQVQRSVDRDASWPLQIRTESAVPLGILLKLLAFENSTNMDFSGFPVSPNVAAHRDGKCSVVSLAEVPEYARGPLLVYAGERISDRDGRGACVPIRKWREFLAS